jgi:hypothetical protein
MSALLITVICLNAFATLALWKKADHYRPHLKRKFAASLFESEPISAPQQRIRVHAPPQAEDEDLAFFEDFSDFSYVLNRSFEGISAWRLLMIPETELKLSSYDFPEFGIRLYVYHNQERVGLLEISREPLYPDDLQRVRVSLKLNWIRFLSFESVATFFDTIAYYVSSSPGSEPDLKSKLKIAERLICALWERDELLSEFSVDFYGQAERYRLSVNRLQSFRVHEL